MYLCECTNKCMYICVYVNKYTLSTCIYVCVWAYTCMCHVCMYWGRVCANTHTLACVRRCRHAYRWSGSAAGRGLYVSPSMCEVDLPRAGACAGACACGVCTAHLLADSRDGWPCPSALRPIAAWVSSVAHHVIRCAVDMTLFLWQHAALQPCTVCTPAL